MAILYCIINNPVYETFVLIISLFIKFSMCNDIPFIKQFHSTVQVKFLNETAIKSKKLTHDTFLPSVIIKMLISLKHDSQICVQIAIH